jgi:hypothetical protein
VNLKLETMKSRLLVLFGAFVVLALSACAGDGLARDGETEEGAASVTTSGTRSEVCTTGLAGFRTEFLPQVQKEICSACHNGDNPNAPAWLIGQDEQIYLSVKNYVTFADIQGSRLFVRAGNRHCGGGCNAAMAARMKGYLERWWNGGEATCDQDSSLRTEPQPVPQDLPTNGYVTMSWDLSSIDVALRGAKVAMEIRRFTDAKGPTPGSYLLRKPRFVSERPISLAVQRMRILNNRNFQEAANQFERVHAVVSADGTSGSALSYPVLSPEPTIVVEDRPGSDELIVTFEKLTPTPPRACRSMDKFRTQVMPVVEARACTSCHVPGATADASATARFDMSGDDEGLCAKFLGRTWTDVNVLPSLIQYPLYGRFEHPRVFLGGNNVLPDWTDWMEAEWR